MKGYSKLLATLIAMTIASSLALTTNAATEGTDNANQTPYDDGWQTGDDGTSGGSATAFGAWTLTTSDTAGHFIGNSTNLSSALPDINVGNESWQLFAGNPGFAAADRSFDSDLGVGQTFSLDLAVNFRNGFKGIDLKDGATTILNFNIGGNDYVVTTNGVAFGSIGSTYSDNTKFHLEFTQLSLSGGSWTITRSGGVADSDSGTYTGVADNFRLYIGNTDGGAPNDLYANSLAIVPEPSTMALVGIGIAGACLLRRRKV